MRKTLDMIEINKIRIHYFEEDGKRSVIYSYEGQPREIISGIEPYNFDKTDKFIIS